MSVFRWNYELHGVGIEEIDTQHRQMVELSNQLYIALTQQQSEQHCKQLLDELVQFSRMHFAAEERLMEEAAYPGLDAHRREHEELMLQLDEFTGAFTFGHPLSAAELIEFLSGWLVNHSEFSDKDFGRYLGAALMCGVDST